MRRLGHQLGSILSVLAIALAIAAPPGCGSGRAEPGSDLPPAVDFDEARYESTLGAIEARRVELGRAFAAAGASQRAAIRDQARRFVVTTIVDQIFPAWMGTPWGLGKTSTSLRPHQPGMTVGCSYFVTSVLLNAGLRLDSRYRFAQAPALRIQRALAPARADLHRFLSIPADELSAGIAALGDGLYLIGLANHVGFVTVAGAEVSFVHASYTAPRVVKVEPLVAAPAITASRQAGYFVTPLFTDADDFLIEKWLAGAEVELVAHATR